MKQINMLDKASIAPKKEICRKKIYFVIDERPQQEFKVYK